MRALFTVGVLLATFGCATSSVSPTAEQIERDVREIATKGGAKGASQLVYSYQRALQLFTCKCEMVSLGGTPREMNLLETFGRDGAPPQLRLTGGATFVSDSVELGFLSPAQLAKLRPVMVQALNKLKVEVYGVSADDLSLGEADFAALQAAATFSFVSLNVKPSAGKLKIVPFVEKTVNDQSYLITSFVSKGTKRSGYVIADPEPLLRELIATHRRPGAILVVMNEESAAERRRLAGVFRDVNVWLGQSPRESELLVDEQYDSGSIFVSAWSRGRAVARIRFERKVAGKTPSLSSPIYVEKARELLARPAGQRPRGDFLERLRRIHESHRSGTHRFAVDIASVSREYEQPRNELTDVAELARKITGLGDGGR